MENKKTWRGLPFLSSSTSTSIGNPGEGKHRSEIIAFGAQSKWSLDSSSIVIALDSRSPTWEIGGEEVVQGNLLSFGYHSIVSADVPSAVPPGTANFYFRDAILPEGILPAMIGSKNKFVRMKVRRLSAPIKANTGSQIYNSVGLQYKSAANIPSPIFIPNNLESTELSSGSGEWKIFEWNLAYPMIANTVTMGIESYTKTIDNNTDINLWTNTVVRGMRFLFDAYRSSERFSYVWKPKRLISPAMAIKEFPSSTGQELWPAPSGNKKIVRLTANVSYSRGTTVVTNESASPVHVDMPQVATELFGGDITALFNYVQENLVYVFGNPLASDIRLTTDGRSSGGFATLPQTNHFLDPPGIDIIVYYKKTDGTRSTIRHDFSGTLPGVADTLWDSLANDVLPIRLTFSSMGTLGSANWASNWNGEKWRSGDAVELDFTKLIGMSGVDEIDSIEAIVVSKKNHQQEIGNPNNRNILYVDSVALHLSDGTEVRIPASEAIYQTKWFGTLSGHIDPGLNINHTGSYVAMPYTGDLVFPGGQSFDGFMMDETSNYKLATTRGLTSHSGPLKLVPGLTDDYKVIDMATPRRSWIHSQDELFPWSDPVPDPQNPGGFQVVSDSIDAGLRDLLLLTQNTAFDFDYTDGPGGSPLVLFRPNLELLEGERIHGPKAAHLAADSNFHLTILDHDDIRNTNTQSYSLWYKPTSERVGKYYPGLASASTTMAEAARIITRDRSEFWSLAAHHGKNWMPAAYSTFNKNPDDYIIHNSTVSEPSTTLANKHYLNYNSDNRIESLTVNTSFGLFGNSSLEATSKNETADAAQPLWSNAPFTLGPRRVGHRANYDSYFNPDVIRIPKGKRWIISYYAYTDGPGGGSQLVLHGKDSENPASKVCKAMATTSSAHTGIPGSSGTITTPGTWQRFSAVADLSVDSIMTGADGYGGSLTYGNIGRHETKRNEVDSLSIRLDVDTAANTVLFDGIMLEQQPDTGITTPSDFVAPSEYLDLYFSGISNTINGGSASDTHALDYLLTSSVANQISSFTAGGLKLDAWNYIALTFDYDTSNTSIYVYNVDDGLTYANTFELPSSYTANVGAAPNWPTSASVYPGTEGRGVALAGGVESANAVGGLISSADTLSALGTYDNIKYCARTLSYDEINDAFYTRDEYVTGPTYEIDWVEVSNDPFEDALANKRISDTTVDMAGHQPEIEVFVPPYTLYVANSTYTLDNDSGQQGTGTIYKVTSNTQDFHTVEVTPYAQSTFILAETDSSHLIGPVHMVADKADNLFALYYEGTSGAAEPNYGQSCHIYQFTADCNTYNISHSTHVKVYSGNRTSIPVASPGQYNSQLNVLEDSYDPYGQNGFDLDESTGALYLGSPNSYRSESSNSGIRSSSLNDPYNQTGNIIKIIPSTLGYEKSSVIEIANSITTGHSCRVSKVFSGPENSVFYIYEDTNFYPPRKNLNQLIHTGIDNIYKNIEVMGTNSSVPYTVNANTVSSLSNGVGDVKAMVFGLDGSLYVSRAALRTEYGGGNDLPFGENLGWIFRIVPDERGSYAVEDSEITIIAENVGVVNSLDVSDINNIFAFSSSNNVTYDANTISTPIYHLTPNTVPGLYQSFVVMEGASVSASNTGTVMRPSSENTNFDGLNLSGAPLSGTILASSRKTMNVYSSDGASTDTDYLYEGALWIKSVYSNTVIRITPDANGSYSSASANVHGIMGTGYLSDGSWSSISNNGEGFMSPIALKKVWR